MAEVLYISAPVPIALPKDAYLNITGKAPTIVFLGLSTGGIFELAVPAGAVEVLSLQTIGTVDVNVEVPECSVVSLNTRGVFSDMSAPVAESAPVSYYARGSVAIETPVAEVEVSSTGTHSSLDAGATAPVTAIASLSTKGTASFVVESPDVSVLAKDTYGACGIVIPVAEIDTISLRSAGILSIEAIAPEISIVPGTRGVVAIEVSAPTASPTTLASSGTIALSIPVPELSALSLKTLGAFSNSISVPTASILSLQTRGTAAVEISAPVADLTAKQSYGSFALSTPAPVAAPISAYTSGTAELETPAADISMVWGLGTGGSVSITVTKPVVTLTMNKSTSGVFAVITPAVELSISTSTYTASYWPCLVLNTDVMLLSEYNNYNFNALASFGADYLALGADGNIYSLGGNLDSSSNIASLVQTGDDDFGTSNKKRVLDVVLGLRANGSLNCSVVRDQSPGSTVTVVTTNTTNIETRKVKTEKTKMSRTFSAAMSNIDSAWFSLDSVEMDVREVARRSGG